MNTPLEAVNNVADRIFLYCDVKEPLVDDFLGEDLDKTKDDNPYP